MSDKQVNWPQEVSVLYCGEIIFLSNTGNDHERLEGATSQQIDNDNMLWLAGGAGVCTNQIPGWELRPSERLE